ncbi:MAG: hypothetical protein AABZ60_13635, partial [Planctomycetota bacterium]
RLLAGPPFNLSLCKKDLEDAQFIFWPSYEDGTEPDLVIIVGNYYILIEAKFHAGFSEETKTVKSQLQRELVGGRNEAKAMTKTFIPVAITAHYSFSEEILNGFNDFKWINWQTVASLLLDIIEKNDKKLNDYFFALDLYNLLDRKNLRGFLSFIRLAGKFSSSFGTDTVFFSAKSAKYRGDFIGFRNALSNISKVNKFSTPLFFSKFFFRNMPEIRCYEKSDLFFRRQHEKRFASSNEKCAGFFTKTVF